MTRYFLSDSGVLWAWKEGDTKLWATEDPVWTYSVGTYVLEDFNDDMWVELSEDKVEEIAGELPTW